MNNSRSLVVRKRMLEVGLRSVPALAVKIDLSESTINHWLANKDVSPDSFAKLARGLELTTEELAQLIDTGVHKAAG